MHALLLCLFTSFYNRGFSCPNERQYDRESIIWRRSSSTRRERDFSFSAMAGGPDVGSCPLSSTAGERSYFSSLGVNTENERKMG